VLFCISQILRWILLGSKNVPDYQLSKCFLFPHRPGQFEEFKIKSSLQEQVCAYAHKHGYFFRTKQTQSWCSKQPLLPLIQKDRTMRWSMMQQEWRLLCGMVENEEDEEDMGSQMLDSNWQSQQWKFWHILIYNSWNSWFKSYWNPIMKLHIKWMNNCLFWKNPRKLIEIQLWECLLFFFCCQLKDEKNHPWEWILGMGMKCTYIWEVSIPSTQSLTSIKV